MYRLSHVSIVFCRLVNASLTLKLTGNQGIVALRGVTFKVKGAMLSKS